MSEMIERVAKAIEAAGYNPATAPAIARIAIEAIREPTDAMLDAPWTAGVKAGDYTMTVNEAGNAWGFMIDEALSDSRNRVMEGTGEDEK